MHRFKFSPLSTGVSTTSLAFRPSYRPSAFLLVAAFFTILFAAIGSHAAAQERSWPVNSPARPAALPTGEIAEPGAAATDDADSAQSSAPPASDSADDATPLSPTLAALVSRQTGSDDLSPELTCLAGAIYFESKGESLAGQLAVGRVIIARSHSGRFPGSYCGVVYQHAQFSFIRGNAMPGLRRDSASWRNAVALARIADAGSWQSPVEGALYFHAARVSPSWHLKRIAQIDNHIFYR